MVLSICQTRSEVIDINKIVLYFDIYIYIYSNSYHLFPLSTFCKPTCRPFNFHINQSLSIQITSFVSPSHLGKLHYFSFLCVFVYYTFFFTYLFAFSSVSLFSWVLLIKHTPISYWGVVCGGYNLVRSY